jgi:hypothetical protein
MVAVFAFEADPDVEVRLTVHGGQWLLTVNHHRFDVFASGYSGCGIFGSSNDPRNARSLPRCVGIMNR